MHIYCVLVPVFWGDVVMQRGPTKSGPVPAIIEMDPITPAREISVPDGVIFNKKETTTTKIYGSCSPT